MFLLVTAALQCALIFCVLAQFAPFAEGMENEKVVDNELIVQQANVFIDAEKLREFIIDDMQMDLLKNEFTERTKNVEIDLLAVLFPEAAEEIMDKETQQLKGIIMDIFKSQNKRNALLYFKALPDMILRRIDQLARRPFIVDKVAKKMKEKEIANAKPSDHHLPSNDDKRWMFEFLSENNDPRKQYHKNVDELAVAELAQKISIKLREQFEESEKRVEKRDFASFSSLNMNIRSYVHQGNFQIRSLDSCYTQQNVVTKIRLLFYHLLVDMINHLDFSGEQRTKLYQSVEQKAYIVHIPAGEAFQLYLAEWLQNGVLNPLGHQIMLELIDHERCDVLLPLCVHMSLHTFLDYDERLKLDLYFQLGSLKLFNLKMQELPRYLLDVTKKLAQNGKNFLQLVDLIQEHIFANFPLPEGSGMKMRIVKALQNAAEGLKVSSEKLEERIEKYDDYQVLLYFFIRFYKELAKPTVPKWLQTLKGDVRKVRQKHMKDEEGHAMDKQEVENEPDNYDDDDEMKVVVKENYHKQQQHHQQESSNPGHIHEKRHAKMLMAENREADQQ